MRVSNLISDKSLNLLYLVTLFSCINTFVTADSNVEGLYKLDIIHYNDFHARFEETSVQTPICTFNNNSCLGGFPRLYQEIRTLLKEKPDSVVLNAGDTFQGTYWYTLLKWNVTQEFMNMIPHDAHALGNHDFDDGPAGVVPYIAALKAPVLAANMDTSEEPSFEGLYEPHIIVNRKGRRIGIIGLITVDTKDLGDPGKVKFTDPIAATRREAQALHEQGVDIIILLSHCGLDVDKEIAREVGEHIDIIIGGHSHSLLWNGPSPSGEVVRGPYPIIIESSEDKKHQVLIVQASAFTKYMGNLSVYFDTKGDYRKWEGGPLFLDRSIPEDAEIKAKLEPYAKLVHEAENESVGESLHDMLKEDCAFGECNVGDLLVAVLDDAVKSVVGDRPNCLSFISRPTIQSSIHQGVVTKGTIFKMLPYNDRIKMFQIKGNVVREALEHSVSEATGYHPFQGPWLLQVSGLQVTYNVSLPEGQRITSVNIGVKGSNNPLDDDQIYTVAAPSFLADGGDGYQMFKPAKQNVSIIGRLEGLVETYISQHSPLDIKTDGRIIINN
ncbi:unnamed protein product [Arctia plantaginis]|uniref:Apyrase n=1 Tax=Arctia plantaginis TaxID=874455 RepID=A0A8S1AKV1_ARCPL|nr:unnamed protein product [Arctia plantaginis]